MPTVKVNPGDRVVVTVEGDDKKTRSASAVVRGPLRKKPDQQFLPRRKRSQFVTFYDLGQILDGSDWVDIDWYEDNFTFAAGPGPANSAGAHARMEIITLAAWQTLVDKIYEIDEADWKDNYRKLGYEDAELYGLDLWDGGSHFYGVGRDGSRPWIVGPGLIDSGKWKTAGLDINSANRNQIQLLSNGAFCGVDLRVGAISKITRELNYAATAVDKATFELDTKAEVYLFPVPCTLYSTSSSGIIAPFSSYAETTNWQPLKRAFWLELHLTDSHLIYPDLAVAHNFGSVVIDTATKAAFLDHIATQPGARFISASRPLASPSTTTYATGAATGTLPSFGPANRTIRTLLNSIFTGTSIQINGSWTRTGSLVCVIKQGGETFYIWRTFDFQEAHLRHKVYDYET